LRGAEANPSGAPIELPRGALALSVYLPTGSEPGKYHVEIVGEPGKPLIGAEGAARLRDHIAVPEVKGGSSTFAPRSLPGRHPSAWLELGIFTPWF